MPNKQAPLCGCGIVFEAPKSRNGVTELTTGNLTILIPKTPRSTKSENKLSKTPSRELGGSHNGSTSSVSEHGSQPPKSNKHKKRMNSARRTRSADRTESHYTYIDSDSSIILERRRENTIPEALYCTIEEPPISASTGDSEVLDPSHRPHPVYAIPSMTSPPPTYDVAIAKTWQSGLPPSYEEYLCHKYAMIARSHTPPPPWSDSVNNIQLSRRDLLTNQIELREHLAQQRVLPYNTESNHYVPREANNSYNQQAHWKQNGARTQRARPMPPRSQSESRVQNQRLQSMYEDTAFCMETTAIQSAFENDVSFCSVM